MNQSDFAWLVGCSASHIQAVEIRRLPLTDRVARRVFAETGVSPEWLLANDFGQPIVEASTGAASTSECKPKNSAPRSRTPRSSTRNY